MREALSIIEQKPLFLSSLGSADVPDGNDDLDSKIRCWIGPLQELKLRNAVSCEVVPHTVKETAISVRVSCPP